MCVGISLRDAFACDLLAWNTLCRLDTKPRHEIGHRDTVT